MSWPAAKPGLALSVRKSSQQELGGGRAQCANMAGGREEDAGVEKFLSFFFFVCIRHLESKGERENWAKEIRNKRGRVAGKVGDGSCKRAKRKGEIEEGGEAGAVL